MAHIGKSFLPTVVPRSAFDIERLRPANQQFSEDEREPSCRAAQGQLR
jgi:hypothetical protein